MATETPVASTKEQVRALLNEGVTDAQEIADRLGKTKATVYVHIRNIKTEAGEKPRGRGRPPKVQKDGETPAPAASTKSRPAPPKAGAKSEAPAPASAATQAKTNGALSAGERFPRIQSAIEQELAEARKEVAMLERMLEATTK